MTGRAQRMRVRVRMWARVWGSVPAARLRLWLCVAAMGTCVRGSHSYGTGHGQGSDALQRGILSVLSSLRITKGMLRAVRFIAPDYFVRLDKRLHKWGYPLESHTVTTEDGYLLTVHRIPHGRNECHEAHLTENKPVVLFTHGLCACSETWTLGGPGIAPGLIFADAGYDVWMINMRGNHYSLGHKTLKSRDPNFWLFSAHDIGMFDLPATIDYILNLTAEKKLYHVSLSMGNTVYFITMTMRPEYNEKIRLQIALAPAIFLDGSKSAFNIAVYNAQYIMDYFEQQPTYELMQATDAGIALYFMLCGEKAALHKACIMIYSTIMGPMDLNDTSRFCMLLSRLTSGSSALVPWHLAQMALSNKFVQYDYGEEINVKCYGTEKPPEYPLEKASAPVAIYVSESDYVVTVQAGKRLANALPNVVTFHVIKEKFFNHIDFFHHRRLNELLLQDILKLMEDY